jgi:hypothetical protein
MQFDNKTGRLLKGKIEARRVFPPAGVEPTDVTLTYTDSSRVAQR